VLLRGFATSWRTSLPVVRLLQEHHEVLAAGLSGQIGRTAPALSSAGCVIDELERDMNEAGLADGHLVGGLVVGEFTRWP
jgi:hypothetical protein